MPAAVKLKSLQRALLAWYRVSRRDLPWRRTRDPYAIWVSEIMLQQTRVAAVQEKYVDFLSRFPNVRALAAADLDEVLAAWSGLGYYRRARALHRAAGVVVGDLKGRLPKTSEGWRALPGIGRYTSAAIASIAFGEPSAVVDGNVERVLRRLLGKPLAGEKTWAAAQSLLDDKAPGDWNQAMMELGAVICTPVQPQCAVCPVAKWCKAPGLRPEKPRQKRRSAEAWYALHLRRGSVLLVQRAASDSLMAGMWELPAAPAAQRGDGKILHRLRHSITNADYRVLVVRGVGKCAGRWVPVTQLDELPLTGLAWKILRKHLGSGGPGRPE